VAVVIDSRAAGIHAEGAAIAGDEGLRVAGECIEEFQICF